MIVVRITQALRQQQQQPCRQNSVRRGGAGTNMLSVSDEPASLRRSTWDNTNNTISLSVDTSSDRGTMENSFRKEQDKNDNRIGSSSASPTSASPSSSFFSFSLSSLLPSSAAASESSAFFFSGVSGEASAAAAAAASSSRPSNVGEIESLLLRSMPMFGNLVSRD
ncbi:hypothetical protein BGZ99_005533 [Dissophora globulifera]|uniref:Uncharacterized protein n=1 Tax=Dissophora globulifera TaxID=979702 RepID=A0A9P6UZY9_9FUNG|nr:hypothetical protein BGZ99_005533 [Dissophora globulifera]